MRNKGAFDRAGFNTLVSSTAKAAAKAARSASNSGQKVFFVGMSIGVIKSSAALGNGAPADGAVFFSGNYQRARSLLKSPANLPPTLLVHHRNDKCPGTTPANVEPFRQWSNGRVEKIVWIKSTGSSRAPPCGAVGAHGFFRKDQQPIAAAIAFIRAH
ncbi:hypothetical protein [Nitratireductor sp. XY-223]|uniref:hypothetical protein n=1 Tax=Nitratireductor sp. XY-223 TaxID=2561926 RepID=UPI0010AA2903|nr:hypothetical protein [Nitratireductor sp. XY-223]